MVNTDTNTTRCPRTSAISPGPPMGPRDFPFVLLLLLPFLGVLSCSTGIAWFWHGVVFFFPFLQLFRLPHAFIFIQKKSLLPPLSPSLHPQEFRPFKQWPQPPSPPRVHLPWLRLCDAAAGVPLGLQPKGKSGLSKANSFIY